MSALGLKHLRKDKVLKSILTTEADIRLRPNEDLYYCLLHAMVSQQLSWKAADTIFKRFLTLFPKAYPEPKLILKMDESLLRSVGLSGQKASYIKNIALFSMEETLDYTRLKKLSDEDLLLYLCRIKGVGRWTAEMILIFSLEREDVFPLADLGIQQAIKDLYGLETTKKDLLADMLQISEKWRPYRSLASLYLWHYKDNVMTKSKKI